MNKNRAVLGVKEKLLVFTVTVYFFSVFGLLRLLFSCDLFYILLIYHSGKLGDEQGNSKKLFLTVTPAKYCIVPENTIYEAARFQKACSKGI